MSFLKTLSQQGRSIARGQAVSRLRPARARLIRRRFLLHHETNHFDYACRDHAAGFAATAVFGSNTPLFGAIDAFGAAEVVTGILGASACCL